MDNGKISIIIPIFNAEKYLCKCLNSLLNQTLKEIEIICVDDGSTDNSSKILKEFQTKDERIKIIYQENLGVAVARNNGIANAKGEYIGFVDSDDWVDKDYFKKLYSAAKKYNVDVAAADFYRIGKILKSKKLKYKKEQFYIEPADKIKATYIPKYNYLWNKIYKRESLEKLNIPFEKGRYYEDMIWLIQVIYFLNGLVVVPNTFYYYRKNEGSIVTQKSFKHATDRTYAEQKMLKFMQEHKISILMPLKKAEKLEISLFGVKFLKIEYYYPCTTKYKLFGFLTIFTIKKIF